MPAGYEVAGKTGTAQKVDSLLGGYSEDRYTSSFMGFAPAEEPKLALLVVIDEPQGGNYGGVVAAPIFKAIMEKVLPYLNVVPKGTMIVKNGLESAPRKEASGSPTLDRWDQDGKGSRSGCDAGPYRVVHAECHEPHRRKGTDHQGLRERKGRGTDSPGRGQWSRKGISVT